MTISPATPAARESAATPSPKIHELDLPVLRNEAVNGQYRLLVLHAPAAVLERCEPGQFFHILCPATRTAAPYLRRPMSIYGFYPEREELHFLYKVAGAGTAALAELREGERLNVLGPLGIGFTIEPHWSHLLLLARGVGLATLAPLAEAAQRSGCRLTAICSARSPDLLMSIERFRDLGASVLTVTDEEGNSGVEALRRRLGAIFADDPVDAAFTCGSSRLLNLLKEVCARHGVAGQVALEQQMACGLGMCQCCVRPFVRDGRSVQLRVCREGPVFDLSEIPA